MHVGFINLDPLSRPQQSLKKIVKFIYCNFSLILLNISSTCYLMRACGQSRLSVCVCVGGGMGRVILFENNICYLIEFDTVHIIMC